MELWQIVLLDVFDTISICLIITKIENKIWENKVKLGLLMTLMVAISTGYDFFELPTGMLVLASCFVILLTILFDIPFLNAMFDYFVVLTLLIIIQIIAMLILQLFNTDVYSFFRTGIIVNTITVIFSYLIHRYIPIQKVESFYLKQKKIINILLLVIVIPLMLYTVIWDANHIEGWKYIPLLFSAIIIWTLIVVIVFFEIIKISEKRKAIKIYEEYNPLLENLMEELKAKQHDIKNHLQTIYGLAQEHSDVEIANYIESLDHSLSNKDKYIHTGNIIISALMYSKRNKAHAKKIPFEFYYENPIPQYPLKEYEITEVIGNIIDNAIEATEQTELLGKKVIVQLKHEKNFKVIEVLNTSEDTNFSESMFQIGYSTKGKKRGYGLYNVERIVKSYKGFIQVSNSDNLTSFKLMFPK